MKKDLMVEVKEGLSFEGKIDTFLIKMYQHYPRKLGKTNGMRKLKAQLRTEKDCQDFARALAKFIRYHEQNKTAAQFIPYFSTFVSTWLEYLDDDACEEKDFKHGPHNLLDF